MRPFSIIFASTSTGGIGRDNTLPWHISNDLKRFQKITKEAPDGKMNAVIMGRKTWESLPKRPLPHRINMVISSSITGNDIPPTNNVMISTTLARALEDLNHLPNLHRIFVIGGAELFKEALKIKECNNIYTTHILSPFIECDTFFPIQEISDHFKIYDISKVQKEGDYEYRYEYYTRKPDSI